MKTTFLLILIVITNSCCNNPDMISYNFTGVEKNLIPYQKQDNIKWQNTNGDTISSFITERNTEKIEISNHDCKHIYGENITVLFHIDNNSYYVSLDKWDNSRLDLSVSKNIGKDNPITFDAPFLNIDSFGNVTFNGEVFNESIKLEANIPNNTLIYSKTHGIEFILFEDGSWYKRVE